MKKKALTLALSLILASSMLLTGCGGEKDAEIGSTAVPGTAETAEASTNAGETQKITVWAWDDNFNVAIMKKAAEYYKQSNPEANVEIEVVSNSKEDIYKKLQTGLASGGKACRIFVL